MPATIDDKDDCNTSRGATGTTSNFADFTKFAPAVACREYPTPAFFRAKLLKVTTPAEAFRESVSYSVPPAGSSFNPIVTGPQNELTTLPNVSWAAMTTVMLAPATG